MKCEFCGAALSLNTKYCPYCGKENIEAKKHVQDMARYQGEFEATKKKVYEKTHAYTHNVVKIAVVAILAIVWVILLIMVVCAWDIERAVIKMNHERNFTKHEARILEYLEQEEYYVLAKYCEENEIWTYDTTFESYEPVLRMSSWYKSIYEDIMQLSTPTEYELEHMEDYVHYLADSVEYFYSDYNVDWKERSEWVGMDLSVWEPELDRMEAKLQVMLRAAVGLTEEEAAQLADMTTGQRTRLLEEGLLNEEE